VEFWGVVGRREDVGSEGGFVDLVRGRKERSEESARRWEGERGKEGEKRSKLT